MNSALTVRNLTKKYSDFTLDNINIEVPKGTIMGFIGANGVGKSTTIKSILDLIKKDSGEIRILGKKLDDKNIDVKENIGVVLDESHFNPSFNVKNINTILKNSYKTWDEEKFFNYMDKFKLPLNKPNKSFSKGMKMKLLIAIALSHDTKLLILDEPTSGLDPMIREEILDIFLEYIQNDENSIFISSHITSDLEKICDYITFIHDGKIILSDEKDKILDDYLLIKCTENDYKNLDKDIIMGKKENKFGVELLVKKDKVKNNFAAEKPNLDDIMLFFTKGVR